MNNQEVIQALKQINLKRVHPFYSWEEMKEVRDIAIQAIEKQIPKKPEFIHMVGDAKGKFRCGCGNIFYHECPTFPDDTMKFCDKCGKKLDWGDTD